MKKAKKVVVFSFILVAILVLLTLNINAEEVVDGTENVADTIQKTDTAIWFEDNLGWFIGIPTGTFFAVVGEFVFLFKKNRNYLKDQMLNIQNRKDVKNFIENAEKQNKEIKNFVAETNQSVVTIGNKVDNALERVDKVTTSIENLTNENKVVVVSVNRLIEILGLMASKDETLVANGTAEKINELIVSITPNKEN